MALCRTGGFFFERWGDAPVHSLAAAMFLNSTEVPLIPVSCSIKCSNSAIHWPKSHCLELGCKPGGWQCSNQSIPVQSHNLAQPLQVSSAISLSTSRYIHEPACGVSKVM